MDKSSIPKTDEALVKEIFRKEFSDFKGVDIKAVRYIEEWINDTYEVFLSRGNESFVLKFPAKRENVHFSDDYGFGKQMFVTDLIRKNTSIRVPKILNRGTHSGIEYLLSEGFDGVALSNVSQYYNENDSREIIRDLGRSLAEVHTIKEDNFGYLSDKGFTKTYNTWVEMFWDYTKKKLDSEHIPTELRERSRALIEKNQSSLTLERDPTLVLYNVHTGNIIVKDGKLTQLYEFGLASFGHKSLEFTHLLDRNVGSVGIREPFLEGYTQAGGVLPDNFRELEVINKVNFYLTTILNYHGATGKREGVSFEYRKKLDKFLSENGF